MAGSVFLKNAQVSGGKWVDLRAQEVAWNLDVFTNIPTTPMKSGIPSHEGDYLGLDNPGITVRGLINYTNNDYKDFINFKLLEQYAQATGVSWFQDKMFTSGTTSIHTGSIGVLIKSIQCGMATNYPLVVNYSLVLQTTSGT